MLLLEDVRKSYDGGSSYVVDGVSLEAGPGELVVLLGESGCGKTTTLKMVNRLVERSAGRIEVGGSDVGTLDPAHLRRRVGYVFQDVGLFPHMTVFENVAITPSLLGWEPARVDARVRALLTLLRLEPRRYAGRMPHELSGGQQQRVGFARALAAEPAVMLLDEPFGALDPITRDRLQREFQRVQAEIGFAALFVTHDMTEALLLATRIVVLQGGRVVQNAAPAEMLRAPANDYVAELVEAPRRQAERLAALADEPDAGAS